MSLRGTGHTTAQLRAAPENALFVWHVDDTCYPKELAKKIGRTDLKIVGPSYVNGNNWMGLSLSGVVVDHYAAEVLSDKTRLNIHRMLARVGRWT